MICKPLRGFEVVATEIESKNRIDRLLLFKALDSQTMKELFPPLEISLQSRHQQTLTKTSRSAQEDIFRTIDQLMNQCSLVDVQVSLVDNLLKGLDTYGIFDSICHIQVI